jgi:hypothetical protein
VIEVQVGVIEVTPVTVVKVLVVVVICVLVVGITVAIGSYTTQSTMIGWLGSGAKKLICKAWFGIGFTLDTARQIVRHVLSMQGCAYWTTPVLVLL